MLTNIQTKLFSAMAGATSQNPVDISKLYPLGTVESVQVALLNLYRMQKVGCCKVTTRGVETIVWWPIGDNNWDAHASQIQQEKQQRHETLRARAVEAAMAMRNQSKRKPVTA